MTTDKQAFTFGTDDIGRYSFKARRHNGQAHSHRLRDYDSKALASSRQTENVGCLKVLCHSIGSPHPVRARRIAALCEFLLQFPYQLLPRRKIVRQIGEIAWSNYEQLNVSKPLGNLYEGPDQDVNAFSEVS